MAASWLFMVRRIRFPVIVPVCNKAILPFTDMGRGDLRDGHPSEEWEQLLFNDILFLYKGVFPETVLHILIVYLHKILKAHGQIGLLGFQKIPFPFLCFTLQLKAPFLFLLFGSSVIGIVEFTVP